jgi:hypothetical protein
MRKFHIFNSDGVKVGEQEHDDSFAPALLAGHVAKIVEVDGQPIAKKAQVEIGPEADQPVPEHLLTEAEVAAEREAARLEREARRAEREAAREAERIAAEPPEAPPPPFEQPAPEPPPPEPPA